MSRKTKLLSEVPVYDSIPAGYSRSRARLLRRTGTCGYPTIKAISAASVNKRLLNYKTNYPAGKRKGVQLWHKNNRIRRKTNAITFRNELTIRSYPRDSGLMRKIA